LHDRRPPKYETSPASRFHIWEVFCHKLTIYAKATRLEDGGFRPEKVDTKEDSKFCAITAYNIKTCKKDVSFRKDNRTNESLDSFQQTLIYSGRVGNKVNIGYREFSGDRARPAYNNDVEYDISTDKVIAYKGADIQIINADNKEITYIVNRNFKQRR
jgi:hypothetical protein